MVRMPSPAPPIIDPMPEPPAPPELDECCGSGCDPCIFDLHERAMEQYRHDLAQWRGRHPELTPVED